MNNNFQFGDVQVSQQVVDVASGEAVNEVSLSSYSFRGNLEEARVFLAQFQAAIAQAESLENN